MTHRYIHGSEKGVDDPLIWFTAAAAGWRQALIADPQGSIIAVADRYGNPVAINAYDEYGVPKPDPYGTPGAGNMGRFQYTGQAWIPEPRHVLLQGSHLLAHAGAVHADGSDRV